MAPAKPELRFTYQDYLNLPEDRRYELIDGRLFITAAPRISHQRISRTIQVALHLFVEENGLGEVFYAPCDVYFSEQDVVQPDILFVSKQRSGIIEEPYVKGAPDLVVEILSSSTEDRDRNLKRGLYDRFGVREYWIVDPKERRIEVLTRGETKLEKNRVFAADSVLRTPLLPDFELPLEQVFP